MDKQSAKRVVEDINSFLGGELWCDFEVLMYQGQRLTVAGSIDPSSSPILKIEFSGVFFLSLPIEWKSNTSETVLTLLDGEEAKKINLFFQVERGHHLFRFTPEYYHKNFGCLVGAKEIGLQSLRT